MFLVIIGERDRWRWRTLFGSIIVQMRLKTERKEERSYRGELYLQIVECVGNWLTDWWKWLKDSRHWLKYIATSLYLAVGYPHQNQMSQVNPDSLKKILKLRKGLYVAYIIKLEIRRTEIQLGPLTSILNDLFLYQEGKARGTSSDMVSC